MPHDLTDRPSGTGATGRADGRDGISAGMPSRRLLLVTAGWWGAAVSAGLTLSACGLRLEDDVTLLPPALRRAMPDEDLLVAARTRAAALAVLARSAPDGALLAGRHERQRDLLDALLDAGGVPADARGPSSTAALSPSSAPTGALPSGSVPPSPTVGTIDLAAAHGAATIDALPGLGQAGVYRAVLTSLVAHDGATAAALGAPVPWPQPAPLPGATATALLGPTRAAVYAAEVAAAHIAPTDRKPLLALLAALQTREQALAAVPGTPPAPLGFQLPFPVTDAPSAARVVLEALTALVDRGLDGLDGAEPTAGAASGDERAEVARLLGQALGWATAAGMPWPDFPGLAVP